MKRRTKYGITGALAGAANGLFGSGGGLFLVPLFTKWIGMEQKRAFATSVMVIFLLSPISLLVFWFRGGMGLGTVWPYLIGGALVGVISGLLFQKASVTLLRRLFGILLLYGGVRAVLLL